MSLMTLFQMARTLATLAAAFLPAIFLLAASAQAQLACMKRDVLLKTLDEKYKESPGGYGIMGGSVMIEVYVSEKGTFTLVSSYSNGVSCIMAAGDSWEALPLPVKGTKS
jgi:hypothetical protein